MSRLVYILKCIAFGSDYEFTVGVFDSIDDAREAMASHFEEFKDRIIDDSNTFQLDIDVDTSEWYSIESALFNDYYYGFDSRNCCPYSDSYESYRYNEESDKFYDSYNNVCYDRLTKRYIKFTEVFNAKKIC